MHFPFHEVNLYLNCIEAWNGPKTRCQIWTHLWNILQTKGEINKLLQQLSTMSVNVVVLLLASSESRDRTLRGPELIKVCSSIFRNQQTNLHPGRRAMRAKHNWPLRYASLLSRVGWEIFLHACRPVSHWRERRFCYISQSARSLISVVTLVWGLMSNSSPEGFVEGGRWPGFRTAEVSWLFLSLFITEMFKQQLWPGALLPQNQYTLGNWWPGIFFHFTSPLPSVTFQNWFQK